MRYILHISTMTGKPRNYSANFCRQFCLLNLIRKQPLPKMKSALRIRDKEKWSVWITIIAVARATSVFVENTLEHANDMVELSARCEDRNQCHNPVS